MTFLKPMDEWLQLLHDSGYRITNPRKAIVELVASSEKALSPIDIYDLGRKEYPGLGLVTVYRTLEKLEDLGLIQRVHQPGGCHMVMRASQGHEHLLLCTLCGKAEYFEGDDLERLFDTISDQSGFEIQEHWLQVFGICSGCRSSAQKSSKRELE
jgi:Fur family transcriptional regulator, ferric uptake regulator